MYHYTSSAGLLGMVTSGKLRASEASSLNDLAEVNLGWRAIERWLAGQSSRAGVDYLRHSVKQSRKDPQHQVFVLSATTAGDDANQWRLYAGGGRGYALEFDGAKPFRVVSMDPGASHGSQQAYGPVTEFAQVLPWHHVLYRAKDLGRALNALAAYVAGELASIGGYTDPESKEHAYEVLAEHVMDELSLLAHLVKGSGFSGEKEVRLVARFIWFGKHVEYRAGAYGIAGHVYLVAGDSRSETGRVVPAPDMKGVYGAGFLHPLPLRRVRLGPLVHKGNRETVRALLRAHGLRSVKVSRSKVSLR